MRIDEWNADLPRSSRQSQGTKSLPPPMALRLRENTSPGSSSCPSTATVTREHVAGKQLVGGGALPHAGAPNLHRQALESHSLKQKSREKRRQKKESGKVGEKKKENKLW
jgi:hypothetical protein